MPNFHDIDYVSADGIRLYARDYPNAEPRATLLCLPGTTANSADFEGFAKRLSGECRVVVPDLRGRGRSEFNLPPGAVLQTLDMADMVGLWDRLALDRVVVLGTSLSGTTAMGISALAAGKPLGPAADELRAYNPGVRRESLLGFVLNDIGPELGPGSFPDPEALRRSVAPVSTWEEAAEQLREFSGENLEDYSDADWARLARARYKENEDGVPALAYHPDVLPPVPEASATGRQPGKPPDLWPLFDMLHDIPALVIRGERSATLTEACVEEMRHRNPGLQAATIPDRGHCPNLEEPESVAAIDRFLASVC